MPIFIYLKDRKILMLTPGTRPCNGKGSSQVAEPILMIPCCTPFLKTPVKGEFDILKVNLHAAPM